MGFNSGLLAVRVFCRVNAYKGGLPGGVRDGSKAFTRSCTLKLFYLPRYPAKNETLGFRPRHVLFGNKDKVIVEMDELSFFLKERSYPRLT